jgi:hypothetical protein
MVMAGATTEEYVARVRAVYLEMEKSRHMPEELAKLTPAQRMQQRAFAYKVIHLVAGWYQNQVTISGDPESIGVRDIQTALAVTMWVTLNGGTQ